MAERRPQCVGSAEELCGALGVTLKMRSSPETFERGQWRFQVANLDGD